MQITPTPTSHFSVLVAEVTKYSLLGSLRGQSLYGFLQLSQSGHPTESGAWRTVAIAGSRSHCGQLAARLDQIQVPRPQPQPPLQTQNHLVMRQGLVSAPGLTGHRGVVLSAYNSCCLSCARLQPPSSPADEDSLVPEFDNLCAFWREVATRGPVPSGWTQSHSKLPGVL